MKRGERKRTRREREKGANAKCERGAMCNKTSSEGRDGEFEVNNFCSPLQCLERKGGSRRRGKRANAKDRDLSRWSGYRTRTRCDVQQKKLLERMEGGLE